MTEATDVEIYIAKLGPEPLKAWLGEQLDDLSELPRHQGMPKNAIPLQGTWQGHTFTVMILEKVVDSFTSLWMDSRHLPWENDRECGLAAARYFNREVRIVAGGWQEHDDPDAWISIDPSGNEREIRWKTD